MSAASEDNREMHCVHFFFIVHCIFLNTFKQKTHKSSFCHAIECQSDTMSDSYNMIVSQAHTATEQVTDRHKGLHSRTAHKCTCMKIHLVRLTQFTKPQCRHETAGNGELVLDKKIPKIVTT